MAGRKKKDEAKSLPLDPGICPSCGHPKADCVITGKGKQRQAVCFNFGCECHVEWKPEKEVVTNGQPS